MSAHILVIEDEEAINDLICMNLEVTGYQVTAFFDGNEASKGLSEKDDYDCALLDVMLPGKDGFALLPELKAHGIQVTAFFDGNEASKGLSEKDDYDCALLDVMLPGKDGFALLPELKAHGIPVIFLTARGEVQNKVRGLKEGAEDYLVKPFEMLELLVRIEKVLERNGRVNSLIQIYDVVIDTEKRTVTKDGQEVYLKPMEYECLLLFVRHKNKALTRKQILGTLWGMEFEGETRTVDAHVGRIRKKLGWGNIIKTIPTVGYRLEVDE